MKEGTDPVGGTPINWRAIGLAFVNVVVGLCILAAVAGTIFFNGWVNFVDNYQMGYKFDTLTGQITVLDEPGYYVTAPIITKVHTIDLRPWQVCINANQRVLNCKLVQFKKEKKGLELFISWHGRKDYEGGSEATGSFTDILKSYAYDGSGTNYPFMTILRDLRPGEVVQVPG